MRLVLLGPPGAGKGTQARLLSKYYSIPHISTGDILREEMKKKSFLAKKIKTYINKGDLVPDEIITKIIKKRLSSSDTQKGFILDGFPRNVSQAKSLDEILKDTSKDSNLKVIYFHAKEKTIVERLSGRRICPKCGAIFHIKNMPPKKDMLCDFCSRPLYQREDDREATVKRRLKIYLKEISSLISYYRRKKRLYEVSADKEAVAVFKVIAKLLKK